MWSCGPLHLLADYSEPGVTDQPGPESLIMELSGNFGRDLFLGSF